MKASAAHCLCSGQVLPSNVLDGPIVVDEEVVVVDTVRSGRRERAEEEVRVDVRLLLEPRLRLVQVGLALLSTQVRTVAEGLGSVLRDDDGWM